MCTCTGWSGTKTERIWHPGVFVSRAHQYGKDTWQSFFSTSNKCIASSNKCLTKKLVVAGALLVITSALLVVARSHKCLTTGSKKLLGAPGHTSY